MADWPKQCSTCQNGRWEGFQIMCRVYCFLKGPLYVCENWKPLDDKDKPR